MQYLEIPIATIIGFLVFKDLPNGLAAVGITITIGAGLYVILRERQVARDERLNAQTTPDPIKSAPEHA